MMRGPEVVCEASVQPAEGTAGDGAAVAAAAANNMSLT